MNKNIIINISQKYTGLFIKYSERLESVLLLIVRLWIANIFWKSGLVKIDDIESTIYLFTDEHPVPFLPPVLAAYSAILFELGCSALLFLGLGARFAAIPLLIMTVVIQFTYLQHNDHFYWAVLLGLVIIRGAGFFSADKLIKWKFSK